MTLATPASSAAGVAPSSPLVRPVVLLILDGVGCRDARPDNAIARAKKPAWDALAASCPHTTIDASELKVGLPEGQMGNSEVGHLNIGAGRVVYQDYTRIDLAIANGEFAANAALADAVAAAKANGSTLHVLGLVSPGGVHSHERQIAAMIDMAASRRRAAGARPRLSRRPRYAAQERGSVARVHRRRVRPAPRRADRLDRRPLLRDGPRPALGSRQRRLRAHGRRPRAVHGFERRRRARGGVRAR